MSQTFQLLQIILFSLPILTLIVLGVVILVKPVAIINRRWYLLVFLPMLLANLLPYIENTFSADSATGLNWRLWLILAADLLLTGWIVHTFRGLQIFGLPAKDIAIRLEQLLVSEGYRVQSHSTQKSVLWGSLLQAYVLTVSDTNHEEDLWITEKSSEAILRAESKQGLTILKSVLPTLRNVNSDYDFKQHAIGLLYLVLAVVFAVLGWSFFFEPRLILIE